MSEQVIKLSDNAASRIKEIMSKADNTTMMSLSGVKQFPMRVKCATLAWHTFIHAAEGKKEKANTEKVD